MASPRSIAFVLFACATWCACEPSQRRPTGSADAETADSGDPDAGNEPEDEADAEPEATELDGALPDAREGDADAMAVPDVATLDADQDADVTPQGACGRVTVIGRAMQEGIQVVVDGHVVATTNRNGWFCVDAIAPFEGAVRLVADAVTLDVPGVRVRSGTVEIWATKTVIDARSRRPVDASEYVPWDTVRLTTLPLVTREPVVEILAVGKKSFLFYADTKQVPAQAPWLAPDSTCSLRRGYFDGTPVATIATNVAHWYNGGVIRLHALLSTARGPAYFFYDNMHAQLLRIDEEEPLLARAGRWVLTSADGHWGLLYDPSQSDLYVADLTSVGPALETRLLASHIKPSYDTGWELRSPQTTQKSVVWGADDYLYFWDWLALGDAGKPTALRRAKASGGPQELVAEQTAAHALRIGQNRIFWQRDPKDADSWIGARPDGSEAFDVRALAGENAGKVHFLDDLRGATFGDPPTRAVLFDAPTELLSAKRFIPVAGALFAESADEPPRISRVPLDGGARQQIGTGYVAWTQADLLALVSSLDNSLARDLTLVKPNGDVFAVAQLAPQEDVHWAGLRVAPDGKTYLYQTTVGGLPGACGEGGCSRTTLHLRATDSRSQHVELGQDIEVYAFSSFEPVYTQDGAAVVFQTLPMSTPWDEYRTLRVVRTDGTTLLALSGFKLSTWSPDGRSFVALAWTDGQPRPVVWVRSDGTELLRAKDTTGFAFSADGLQLSWLTQAFGEPSTLHVASAHTGETLMTTPGGSLSSSSSGLPVGAYVNGSIQAPISEDRALVSHTAHPALPASLHLLDLAR